MAKQEIKVGICFDYDPADRDGLEPHIFLYQLLNRLNYEYPIKSVRLKGVQRNFSPSSGVSECELKRGFAVEGEPYVET